MNCNFFHASLLIVINKSKSLSSYTTSAVSINPFWLFLNKKKAWNKKKSEIINLVAIPNVKYCLWVLRFKFEFEFQLLFSRLNFNFRFQCWISDIIQNERELFLHWLIFYVNRKTNCFIIKNRHKLIDRWLSFSWSNIYC